MKNKKEFPISDFVVFLIRNNAHAAYRLLLKGNYGTNRSTGEVLNGVKPENYISHSIQTFLVGEETTKISDSFWLGLHGKWLEVLSNVHKQGN